MPIRSHSKEIVNNHNTMLSVKTMHDVFISYQHESKNIADAICSMLEHEHIKCWYAPRDTGTGDYASNIVEAINSCKVFVLVLSADASRSDHVLNEVELAYNRKRDGLVILPFRVSDEMLSDAMEYYIKRLHWIDAVSDNLETALANLVKNCKAILGISEPIPTKTAPGARHSNSYFEKPGIDERKEMRRIAAQIRCLNNHAGPIYDRVFSEYEEPNVLDVGSNDGSFTNKFLISRMSGGKLVGIDRVNRFVQSSRDRIKRDNVWFHEVDCESPDFYSDMTEIMDELEIQGFDIINISMLLMHLKNPFKVLKSLRRLMSDKGCFIIIDPDYGLNYASPDPNGMFERLYEIYETLPTAGFTRSGRQIYSLLKKLDMNDVCLERIGYNTSHLDVSQKEDLFDACVRIVPLVIKETLDNGDSTSELEESYEWVLDNMDNIEELFFRNDFLYSFGFMVYTARN